LSALACFSDGEDSKAAQVAKHEEGRRLAGHLATKISLTRNRRAAKALDGIRERNKPPRRERFEALLRELYLEAPPAWAERSSTDRHLRATRSATLKKIEGRDRQEPSTTRELATFAEREALLRRASDARLTPREHELFEFFLDIPSARNADAARALDIAVGTVKSFKSRIAKRLHTA
jgi:DNA-binding CsgD family transcriptional regulator